MKQRRMIDRVVVQAAAGNGGNGCVAFRREKYVPRGGPSGGDGGRGGHVIFRGSKDEDSLIDLHFAPLLRAEHGEPGGGQEMHGRNGRDLYVLVPCGTEVWDEDTGEMIGDITDDGQELHVAKGGKGGLGNVHWVSSTHQVPTEHTPGADGQTRKIRLDLKLIAEVGLAGLPNAGKSSLVSVLTNAHPKIAPYPFTTLNPIIGTLKLPDYRSVRIADIPGLIEGAHAGAGLGHAFLRHVERSRALVLVIDMAGVDARNPVDDYRTLIQELKLYRKELARRPMIVAANKMDLPEAAANLREFKRRVRGRTIIPVSATTRSGIEELIEAIRQLSLAG